MSRFIPHSEMTAAELINCSYEAMAIIAVCRAAADGIGSNLGEATNIASSIDTALGIVTELLGPVHDALELHEGVKEAVE